MTKVIDKEVVFWVDQDNKVYDADKKLLKVHKPKKRHPYIRYHKNGCRSYHRYAVLIAKAFAPNPNNYKYVRHKNGHIWDTSKWNLEWTDEKWYKPRTEKTPVKRQYFTTFHSQKELKDFFADLFLDVEFCDDGDILIFRDGKLCSHFLILRTSKNSYNLQIVNIPSFIVKVEARYPSLLFINSEQQVITV